MTRLREKTGIAANAWRGEHPLDMVALAAHETREGADLDLNVDGGLECAPI